MISTLDFNIFNTGLFWRNVGVSKLGIVGKLFLFCIESRFNYIVNKQIIKMVNHKFIFIYELLLLVI